MASLTPQLAGDDGSSASSGNSPPPNISAGETQGSSTKQDDNRQVGDLSIYLYYFSSLGWLSFALFGIFVASNVAFSTLQCKYASSIRSAPFYQCWCGATQPQEVRLEADVGEYRCMDHTVGPKQRRIASITAWLLAWVIRTFWCFYCGRSYFCRLVSCSSPT
jgi:hypothetical protein